MISPEPLRAVATGGPPRRLARARCRRRADHSHAMPSEPVFASVVIGPDRGVAVVGIAGTRRFVSRRSCRRLLVSSRRRGRSAGLDQLPDGERFRRRRRQRFPGSDRLLRGVQTTGPQLRGGTDRSEALQVTPRRASRVCSGEHASGQVSVGASPILPFERLLVQPTDRDHGSCEVQEPLLLMFLRAGLFDSGTYVGPCF